MSQNNMRMTMPRNIGDAESTRTLNLTVLQRMDPYVEQILITAAHVTLYEFNVDCSEWSRKDVEGSLFVVKRNAQPRFQFIVMNRRNIDNLVENLLGDFEFEIQQPYLLYKNADQEVNGIWFYNPRECEEVARLFTRIITAYSKATPKAIMSAPKSDFEELEAVPTMAAMEGPLERSSLTPSITTDITENSTFVNFFSAAGNTENESKALTPVVQSYQSLAISSPRAPASLISTPPTPPPMQMPSAPSRTSSIPLPFLDTPENNITTSLVKPYLFYAPPTTSSALVMPPLVPSSIPTAPPLHPPVTLHRPYGSPLLQPFPPPAPPLSLTPAFPNDGIFISRDKIRDALLKLVQNDQFIDMFYQELLKGSS